MATAIGSYNQLIELALTGGTPVRLSDANGHTLDAIGLRHEFELSVPDYMPGSDEPLPIHASASILVATCDAEVFISVGVGWTASGRQYGTSFRCMLNETTAAALPKTPRSRNITTWPVALLERARSIQAQWQQRWPGHDWQDSFGNPMLQQLLSSGDPFRAYHQAVVTKLQFGEPLLCMLSAYSVGEITAQRLIRFTDGLSEI